MKIENLKRAGEIADAMPKLEKARQMLFESDYARVFVKDGFDSIELPSFVHDGLVSVIDCEINRLEKEVEEL